jgi:hypothetical protein
LSQHFDVRNIEQLRDRWPSTQESLGHYSRKVKNEKEYSLLLEALTKVIRIIPLNECPRHNWLKYGRHNFNNNDFNAIDAPADKSNMI